MAKKSKKITVVLENPEFENQLAEKAIYKLYELYMESKLKGELDNLENN